MSRFTSGILSVTVTLSFSNYKVLEALECRLLIIKNNNCVTITTNEVPNHKLMRLL